MIKQLLSLACISCLLVASGCSMSQEEKPEQPVTTQSDDGSMTEPSTEGSSEEMGATDGDGMGMSDDDSAK